MNFDASMHIREGDYVEHDTTRRWGRVVKLVWGDHGMLGSNLESFIVELSDGEIVAFDWIDTNKLSALEVLAKL